MEYNYKNAQDNQNKNLHKIEPCYGTTYIRHINGLYLSMDNNGICLSRERFLWRVEAWENDRFYIRDISGHDHLEYYGGNVQKAPDSGYTEQHWRLYRDSNNFVFFEHADSEGLFLCCSEDNKPLMHGDYNDESCYFAFEECCLTYGYPYVEFKSVTGKIILRAEPTILYYANQGWLIDWINDLEKAYYSLSRLVGFYPFPQIEIRAYTNCNTWGYIFYGKPVVHINNDCMKKEIIRMRKCKNRDISFGTLHEMSHLFDKGSWLFDSEALANIKLGYVLHELDFNASLAHHTEYAGFNRRNFTEELYKEHGRLDSIKGLFCSSLTAKMGEIADIIGWDAFAYAFKNFPDIYNETKLRKLEVFISKLSEYSNVDVRGMFSIEEWSSVEKNIS